MKTIVRLNTILAIALALLSLSLSPVFAEDAGATDASNATTDAGSTTEIDAASPATDAGTPATDAGTSTGSFSKNPCWDEQCTAESAACQADSACTAYNTCYNLPTDEEKNSCIENLVAEIGEDAANAGATLHTALRECGWKGCNDPNAASCGDPGKDGAANRCGQWDDLWACNCDKDCESFGDCCADLDAVCVSSASCAGVCESEDPIPDGLGGNCYCDASCLTNNDCCPDYESECSGTACTPNCAGKQCGDDGCGGTCGSCEGNFTCNADAQCEGGTTPPTGEDVVSSADSTSNPAADAGSTSSDTSGTPPPTTGGGEASSGGCSAQKTAHTPWALVLLCALVALGLRRRRQGFSL